MADLGEQIARAVEDFTAQRRAVGNFGRYATPRDAVLQRIGVSPPVLEGADVFVMRDGRNVHLGRCQPRGVPRPYTFDLLIPHLGILADYQSRPDDEVQAKSTWAKAKGVHYVHGTVDEIAAVVERLRKRPPTPPKPRPPRGDPEAVDRDGFRVAARWRWPLW